MKKLCVLAPNEESDQTANAQADLNLHWADMFEGTFSEVAIQISFTFLSRMLRIITVGYFQFKSDLLTYVTNPAISQEQNGHYECTPFAKFIHGNKNQYGNIVDYNHTVAVQLIWVSAGGSWLKAFLTKHVSYFKTLSANHNSSR